MQDRLRLSRSAISIALDFCARPAQTVQRSGRASSGTTRCPVPAMREYSVQSTSASYTSTIPGDALIAGVAPLASCSLPSPYTAQIRIYPSTTDHLTRHLGALNNANASVSVSSSNVAPDWIWEPLSIPSQPLVTRGLHICISAPGGPRLCFLAT
jgi:hypothetical protein